MTKRGNKKIRFHKFTLGDVDDPDIYAQFYAEDWLKTDEGSWAEKNSEDELTMTYEWDHDYMGHVVGIWGKLSAKNYTYWKLKFKS